MSHHYKERPADAGRFHRSALLISCGHPAGGISTLRKLILAGKECQCIFIHFSDPLKRSSIIRVYLFRSINRECLHGAIFSGYKDLIPNSQIRQQSKRSCFHAVQVIVPCNDGPSLTRMSRTFQHTDIHTQPIHRIFAIGKGNHLDFSIHVQRRDLLCPGGSFIADISRHLGQMRRMQCGEPRLRQFPLQTEEMHFILVSVLNDFQRSCGL